MLYAFISSIAAALVAIFAKLGLKDIDSTLAATVRSIIMTGFLIVVSFFLKKFDSLSLSVFGAKDWILIFLVGIAGAISWLFYFLALRSGLATGVAAIDRLSVVFVVIFAVLFLGETLNWKVALGAVFMVVGAIMIILK